MLSQKADSLDPRTDWPAPQHPSEWGANVENHHSIGDASIVNVANNYCDLGFEVEIFTGDSGLKAYEPLQPSKMRPRRRR